MMPSMTDDLHQAMAAFQVCIERRDRPTAEAVLDEEFALVLVHPSTVTISRDRWLDMLPDYRVHSYQVEEVVLDVAGDLAVVLQRARMSATVLGEDRSGSFVITDVWRRRSGAWRLWRRHSTPLTAGDMPPGG